MTKSNAVGVSRTATPPAPDPLEQLLDAEASLADEYERAHDDAARFLSEARARAEAIARESAERVDAERRRIAERLEVERSTALAALATETARGTTTFALDDSRIASLADEVVAELLVQLRLEAQP